MRRILTHCSLERRRIVFAALVAFFAGFVLYSHVSREVLGLPAPVFIGFLYMVMVGIGAAVTTFIFPKLRRLIDCIAFARVGLAFWVVATQSFWLVAAPLASAVIVVSSAVMLLWLGRGVARLVQKDSASETQFAVFAPLAALFSWLDNSEGYAQILDAYPANGQVSPATS